MEQRANTKFVYLLIYIFLVACSRSPAIPRENTESPPGEQEQGVVIDNCEGLVGSYETAGPRPLENAPPDEPFSAWLVAFLENGSVLWKYSPEVFTGSFTCRDNMIMANFPDGTRPGFKGVFDPKDHIVSIEDLVYYKATEE